MVGKFPGKQSTRNGMKVRKERRKMKGEEKKILTPLDSTVVVKPVVMREQSVPRAATTFVYILIFKQFNTILTDRLRLLRTEEYFL
jgi:hypothetical protein